MIFEKKMIPPFLFCDENMLLLRLNLKVKSSDLACSFPSIGEVKVLPHQNFQIYMSCVGSLGSSVLHVSI